MSWHTLRCCHERALPAPLLSQATLRMASQLCAVLCCAVPRAPARVRVRACVQVITRHGFHVIAALCETVLFVYAGLDMW